MDFNIWHLVGLGAGALVGSVGLTLWTRFVPNDKLAPQFRSWGKVSSFFIKSKIGAGWDKAEVSIIGTMIICAVSYVIGMFSDNKKMNIKKKILDIVDTAFKLNGVGEETSEGD